MEPEQLEVEVLRFYRTLMGRVEERLEEMKYAVMREGAQLSHNQRKYLILPVTDKEIRDSLSGIGEDKNPGIDGYGVIFSKMLGT